MVYFSHIYAKLIPILWISNQKWPRFAPKLAVHGPKFWGKIARILVQWLLVRSGLRSKITVLGTTAVNLNLVVVRRTTSDSIPGTKFS